MTYYMPNLASTNPRLAAAIEAALDKERLGNQPRKVARVAKEFNNRPLAESLARLMRVTPLRGEQNVGKEAAICMDFAESLRLFTLSGELKAWWFHVPNEGKRGRLTAAILRLMGLIPGVPDYIFNWNGGSGCIEFKAPGGAVTDYQCDFRAWVCEYGANHEIAYSAEEGLEILKSWGVLELKPGGIC